jgi:hypothetical protein
LTDPAQSAAKVECLPIAVDAETALHDVLEGCIDIPSTRLPEAFKFVVRPGLRTEFRADRPQGIRPRHVLPVTRGCL